MQSAIVVALRQAHYLHFLVLFCSLHGESTKSSSIRKWKEIKASLLTKEESKFLMTVLIGAYSYVD